MLLRCLEVIHQLCPLTSVYQCERGSGKDTTSTCEFTPVKELKDSHSCQSETQCCNLCTACRPLALWDTPFNPGHGR
ncbi:hypothetical protein O3P69_007380 [Scylla paramamosain]|uniref:Uncharacterized protein n=1 Tax=Scylla paramamosain TaxID=85552 RepID=A0AAW0V369_SCYPA